MTQIRTHRVATAAYRVVEARRSASFKKKYGALTHKLPGMVLQNGLAQATGFLLAKGEGQKSKEEHIAVLEDLRAVLSAGGTTQAADYEALHQEIIAADLARTMVLTRAALDAAAWMKRYVQGVLGVDATGATQEPEDEPERAEEGAAR
jgi:CRISPR-associated protein Cmr5